MIIVTGGAGFIGSNLVRGLNREGIKDILIVDNLGSGSKHKNLNSLDFTDYVDKLDFINNLDFYKNLKVEALFHQGACSSTMETDGRYMMQNNYEYSKTMLEFCMEKKAQFIYASSASVYGNGDSGFKEERQCEYPLNVYAFSKYVFDQYVRKIIHQAKIQIIGLRYFNVYGPQECHKDKMASVAYHFHNQLLTEGKMKLFEGSEAFLRDFVFVDDVVKVNLFFYKNPEKKGIFNCGTGKAESFMKIADVMKPLYEKAEIETIPFPDKLKGKYQAYTQADLTNLRNAGYQEAFSGLDVGLKKYVQILKTNDGYYRN